MVIEAYRLAPHQLEGCIAAVAAAVGDGGGRRMLEDLLVKAEAPIRDTLIRLNRNELGIAFVVDDTGRLEGVATDGDIRRGLLDGATLESPISRVMNRNALALPAGSDRHKIVESLTRRIRLIPLLDADRRVVDYASLARYTSIPVANPSLDGNERAYVLDCLESGWISSQGGYLRKFEAALAEFLGVEHALAVSNGTVALHLALVTLGIGPGDEVIVPDLTFAASASAVVHAGATPVLVDVERTSWTLDLDKAASAIGPRTRAIMPVHLYGQPADMDGVKALADRHGLLVIEDAAEALGSTWKGRRVGSIGDASTFSFFANKIVTTGEGGMVVFADSAKAERARRLRDHGMNPAKRYWHDEIGFNYRMTNMQAAIGVAQMERIESFIQGKLALAERYREGCPGLRGSCCQSNVRRSSTPTGPIRSCSRIARAWRSAIVSSPASHGSASALVLCSIRSTACRHSVPSPETGISR